MSNFENHTNILQVSHPADVTVSINVFFFFFFYYYKDLIQRWIDIATFVE
jgi:hypothetical protein